MKKFLILLAAITAGFAAKAQTDAVKITFLSWLTGSTKVSYEKALPGRAQTAEICASLICAGYDKYDNNPLGFTTRYAHKFFFALHDEDHPLRGAYLRPEAIWSKYKHDSHETPGVRKLANMGTVIATAGIQWNWSHFLADAWFGGGPAFGTPSETLYHHGFALWNYLGTTNEHIAMSFSIRLGYCF